MNPDTITYSQVLDILEQNKELEARLSLTTAELAKVESMFTKLTKRYSALVTYVKTLESKEVAASPIEQRRGYIVESVDYIQRRKEAGPAPAQTVRPNP